MRKARTEELTKHTVGQQPRDNESSPKSFVLVVHRRQFDDFDFLDFRNGSKDSGLEGQINVYSRREAVMLVHVVLVWMGEKLLTLLNLFLNFNDILL